ncbi:hypothetical protein CDL15_Pgr011046 [Punica granatum]|uniref:TPX2 C-terminal domain-containing protein n=1 Tax=Punica granatum TaxID=22663 RepID=A0A218XPN0_PUNGR|nr:hypothetical protein CDL15_Pgr011046 [Punica granatum]
MEVGLGPQIGGLRPQIYRDFELEFPIDSGTAATNRRSRPHTRDFQRPLWVLATLMADSIHSGSISFGRFESEPLSWERRSSFSHNRYLEEVEKYSRPGSVNEKKAYFEAHFRKKLLLQQSSTDEQTVTENQNDEHGSSENTDYREEFQDTGHREGFQSIEIQNTGYIEEFQNIDHREEFQLANKEPESCHFDESPESSVCGRGESEVRSSPAEESQIDKVQSEIEVTVHSVPVEVSVETETKTEQAPECDGKEEEVSSQVSRSSLKYGRSDTTCRSENHCPSAKMADAVELKPRKISPKSQPSGAHWWKHVRHETAEDSQKKTGSRIGTPLKTNKERPAWGTSVTATHSVRGTPKSENRDIQRSRAMPENRRLRSYIKISGSVRESKGKKFTESSPMATIKVNTRGDSTGSRLWQKEEAKKPEVKPKTGSFSFKSDERAERRKEFFMKLEERMHAKETKISQIQAKAQAKFPQLLIRLMMKERKEAEIKQFRKSLKFKATPMPSFYQTDANKSSRKIKPTQSLNEPPGSQKQSTPRSRPQSKTGARSFSSASNAMSITNSLNITSESISTTGVVKSQKDIRTGRTMVGNRTMKNEMPNKGTRSVGMSRTAHVAVIRVGS